MFSFSNSYTKTDFPNNTRQVLLYTCDRLVLPIVTYDRSDPIGSVGFRCLHVFLWGWNRCGQEILLPQFLQNLASIGLAVPQVPQSVELSRVPHFMQCFAPASRGAPHFPHHFALDGSSIDLAGARALGENTSARITTSPTVAILSWPTSNSRANSLSSSKLLNCSLSTDKSKDLISPVSLGIAFRTLPTNTP